MEYAGNFARHADTAGGRKHGRCFYVTTERDLTIYDVRNAEKPRKVGHLPLTDPGTPVFTEEDPDTNGKVLLVWNGGGLSVIDVSDKSAPRLLSTLEDSSDQHIVSCVPDCTWAYGSEGAIVDLRNPAEPRLSDLKWNAVIDPDVHTRTSFHDVTEVAPGLMLTSSEPMLLLDARNDPERPTVLATTTPPGFTHANLGRTTPRTTSRSSAARPSARDAAGRSRPPSRPGALGAGRPPAPSDSSTSSR